LRNTYKLHAPWNDLLVRQAEVANVAYMSSNNTVTKPIMSLMSSLCHAYFSTCHAVSHAVIGPTDTDVC